MTQTVCLTIKIAEIQVTENTQNIHTHTFCILLCCTIDIIDYVCYVVYNIYGCTLARSTDTMRSVLKNTIMKPMMLNVHKSQNDSMTSRWNAVMYMYNIYMYMPVQYYSRVWVYWEELWSPALTSTELSLDEKLSVAMGGLRGRATSRCHVLNNVWMIRQLLLLSQEHMCK